MKERMIVGPCEIPVKVAEYSYIAQSVGYKLSSINIHRN